MLILFILLVSLYYFATTLLFKSNQPSYLKILDVVVIFFSIYGLYSILTGTVAVTEHGTERGGSDFLRQYYSSLLPIYAYYSFAKQGLINQRWLYRWSWIFVVVAVIAFFTRRQEMLLAAYYMGLGQTEFTNNIAYLFVALIPLIALVSNKKYYHWLLWTVVLVFSLLSFKRGAILVSAISFIYYLFLSFGSNSKNKNRYVIISILVIVAVYFTVEYLFQSSDYFRFRLEVTEEGAVSQRDVLFSSAWQVFKDADLAHKLLGYGANMTASLIGNGAHNDWLEILVNHGLVGITLFIFYWITLFKTWRKTKYDESIRMALGLFFIVTFLRTLFSFSIGDMSFFEASVVGYCLAFRNTKYVN